MSNLTKTSSEVTQGVKPVLTHEKPTTCSFSQDFANSQKNYSSVEKSTVSKASDNSTHGVKSWRPVNFSFAQDFNTSQKSQSAVEKSGTGMYLWS